MSKRDDRSLLDDIIASIERIERFIGKHNAASFEMDEMATDATVLNLAIIGEAAKQIPDPIKNLMPGIVWKDIIGLRNIIIHKYFAVDLEIVWKIVTQDLPPLKLKIQAALDQLNNTPQNQTSD